MFTKKITIFLIFFLCLNNLHNSEKKNNPISFKKKLFYISIPVLLCTIFGAKYSLKNRVNDHSSEKDTKKKNLKSIDINDSSKKIEKNIEEKSEASSLKMPTTSSSVNPVASSSLNKDKNKKKVELLNQSIKDKIGVDVLKMLEEYKTHQFLNKNDYEKYYQNNIENIKKILKLFSDEIKNEFNQLSFIDERTERYVKNNNLDRHDIEKKIDSPVYSFSTGYFKKKDRLEIAGDFHNGSLESISKIAERLDSDNHLNIIYMGDYINGGAIPVPSKQDKNLIDFFYIPHYNQPLIKLETSGDCYYIPNYMNIIHIGFLSLLKLKKLFILKGNHDTLQWGLNGYKGEMLINHGFREDSSVILNIANIFQYLDIQLCFYQEDSKEVHIFRHGTAVEPILHILPNEKKVLKKKLYLNYFNNRDSANSNLIAKDTIKEEFIKLAIHGDKKRGTGFAQIAPINCLQCEPERFEGLNTATVKKDLLDALCHCINLNQKIEDLTYILYQGHSHAPFKDNNNCIGHTEKMIKAAIKNNILCIYDSFENKSYYDISKNETGFFEIKEDSLLAHKKEIRNLIFPPGIKNKFQFLWEENYSNINNKKIDPSCLYYSQMIEIDDNGNGVNKGSKPIC